MASGINFYSYIVISLIRIGDIANSNWRYHYIRIKVNSACHRSRRHECHHVWVGGIVWTLFQATKHKKQNLYRYLYVFVLFLNTKCCLWDINILICWSIWDVVGTLRFCLKSGPFTGLHHGHGHATPVANVPAMSARRRLLPVLNANSRHISWIMTYLFRRCYETVWLNDTFFSQ